MTYVQVARVWHSHTPFPGSIWQNESMWRTFDVEAVVESLVSDGAVVVAGASGLGRQVRRARIANTPSHLAQVGAHELVVVNTESLIAAGGSWDEVIGALDAANAAAVALRFDLSNDLPLAMLTAADRLDFPIIAFPPSEALEDITTDVLDALLNAQEQRLERFLDIHQRFAPVMLAGGGAAEIAATLHDLLQFPIIVRDPAGHVTVRVPSDLDVDLDEACATGLSQPILAGEHDYGEILVLSGGVPLDDEQLLALERASAAIAVRLAHSSAVAADHERFAATSLEELIAGHTSDAADVTERAAGFGWDLSLKRAVLLASVDPPTLPETLRPALDTIAAAARATLGRHAIVWTRSTTIAALVAPKTNDPEERRRIAEALRLELDHRLRTVTVSIGVGRRVDTPLDLSRSYLEATRAVDVGRWAKGRHVTEVFDQLGLERLLASTPDRDLAEFVEHAIGPLVQHDRAHQTDLVETLGVWLDTRNMAEAARLTHVHYNTLKNRLDRVESILGPILTDSSKSLECAVAIYVSRHYDGPWSSPVASDR